MDCLNPIPSTTYPELEMALLKHIHLFMAKALCVVAYRDTTESIVQGTPAYCILLTSCWLDSDFHLIVFLFKMSAAPAVNLISISYLLSVMYTYEQCNFRKKCQRRCIDHKSQDDNISHEKKVSEKTGPVM